MGRVVVIGDEFSRVQVRDKQLQVVPRNDDGNQRSTPVEDLDMVLIDTVRGMTVTSNAIQTLVEHHVAVVFTDSRHQPAGILLPLTGTVSHGAVLKSQVEMTVPRSKRAWQTIVRAKIRAQRSLLERDVALCLERLEAGVKSGDPDNNEAQAAQIYWPALLGPDFRRVQRLSTGPNAALDYGYSIVRSLLARAVVATGLHPAVSIHHSVQRNPFALVDDLVEPLRPAVDGIVRQLALGDQTQLDPVTKRSLVSVLQSEWAYGARTGPLTEAVERYADSFRRYVQGEDDAIDVPVMAPAAVDK